VVEPALLTIVARPRRSIVTTIVSRPRRSVVTWPHRTIVTAVGAWPCRPIVAAVVGALRPWPRFRPVIAPRGRGSTLPWLLVPALAVVHPSSRLVLRRARRAVAIVRALIAPRLERPGPIVAPVVPLTTTLVRTARSEALIVTRRSLTAIGTLLV
jgi:hypothetical protein